MFVYFGSFRWPLHNLLHHAISLSVLAIVFTITKRKRVLFQWPWAYKKRAEFSVFNKQTMNLWQVGGDIHYCKSRDKITIFLSNWATTSNGRIALSHGVQCIILYDSVSYSDNWPQFIYRKMTSSIMWNKWSYFHFLFLNSFAFNI